MIVKRLLLNQATLEGGNGSATATSPVADKAPLKPVVPSAPPAEELNKSFDASDDHEFIGDEPVVDEKKLEKVVEDTKVVEKKVDDKKQDKVQQPVKVEEKKGPDILGKLPKKGEARDYTGFNDQEQSLLKGMSNESFAYFSDLLKKSKSAPAVTEPAKPSADFIFQHPQGYVFSPEYQQLNTELQMAKSEGNAWMQELIKAQKGEKWRPLVGIDDKTGKFIYGEERQPTLEDVEMLRRSVGKCEQYETNVSSSLNSLPQTFNNKLNTDLQNINQERAKRFDWVANPELLKAELEIEGVGKKSVSAIREDFVNIWPEYMRRTPGVEVAADLWVAMQVYSMRLKSAEAGKAVAETLREESRRVEPTSSARVNSQKTRHGVAEFDLGGLPD